MANGRAARAPVPPASNDNTPVVALYRNWPVAIVATGTDALTSEAGCEVNMPDVPPNYGKRIYQSFMLDSTRWDQVAEGGLFWFTAS